MNGHDVNTELVEARERIAELEEQLAACRLREREHLRDARIMAQEARKAAFAECAA